jgi:hypothetical protein
VCVCVCVCVIASHGVPNLCCSSNHRTWEAQKILKYRPWLLIFTNVLCTLKCSFIYLVRNRHGRLLKENKEKEALKAKAGAKLWVPTITGRGKVLGNILFSFQKHILKKKSGCFASCKANLYVARHSTAKDLLLFKQSLYMCHNLFKECIPPRLWSSCMLKIRSCFKCILTT